MGRIVAVIQFLVWVGVLVGCWYGMVKYARIKKMAPLVGHFTGAGVGFGVATAVLIAMITQPTEQELAAQEQKINAETQVSSACLEAQDAVRIFLKSPKTAEFPGCVFSASEYEIRTDAERRVWFVKGYVDSQNSFGAMLRKRWIVKLERSAQDGKDTWMALKVSTE